MEIGAVHGKLNSSTVLKHVHKIAFFTALLLVAGGCVSQKKKGDVSWAKRRWQDMNSHYNGYFNANVMYEEALAKLNEAHKDNYNQVLDVYPYEAVTADEAKQVKEGCDNIVKKMAKTVALHRSSEWVDDCYLMVGKAYFLKKDYEAAEEALRFALDEFNPEKPVFHKRKGKMTASEKKRAAAEKAAIKKEKDDKKKSDQKAKKKAQEKKKKEAAKKKKSSKGKGKSSGKKEKMDEKSFDKPTDKPSKAEKEEDDDKPAKPSGKDPYASRFMHRRPAYPELQLWMGRTLIQRDKNDEAEFLFNQMSGNPFFPSSLRDDLAMAEAHNFLKQKQWDKAVAPLEQAIKLTKKKRQRARLAYILAQIHSKAGRSAEAVAAYQQVLKSGPVYDMEFSARLHMMLDAYYNGTASDEATQKGLQKMLRDDKNIDYRDQIYFILAQIDIKNGDKTAAIDHLRKSLAASSTNKNQKAESYWAIAGLYFDSEKFVEAKLYYDSTLTVLPNTDPRYAEATRYAKSLQEIAAFITSVVLDDSLRAIYNMSDEQKKALATKIKKDREAEIEAATKAASATTKPAPGGLPTTPRVGGPPPLGPPNNFYFYNDANVKKGKRDFAKQWGDRKNEDNWQRSRRSDSNSASDAGTETAATEQPDLSKAELDDLLPGIPKSADELAALDSTEANILFKLGKAFRDQLENNKRSSETHERMFADFPQYVKTNELEAWFYLYLSFTDLGNTAKAKEYYDKIVGKYPNSSYAKSLTDPNFKDLTTQRARELNAFYKETYRIFQSGDFTSASARCVEAEKKFGTTNALATKFALLSTMCSGSVAGKDGYCKSLKEFIAKYPDTEEKTRATEIARVLGCEGFQAAEPDKKGEDGKNAEGYTLEDDKLHYFLIVLTGGDVKLDNVKADISDYNRQYHKLDQLRVSNIYLGTDTETPIIVIRKFDNRKTAMAYYDELTKAKDFIKEKRVKTEFFAITQNNYRVLLGKKRMDEYRSFFGEKYLK